MNPINVLNRQEVRGCACLISREKKCPGASQDSNLGPSVYIKYYVLVAVIPFN